MAVPGTLAPTARSGLDTGLKASGLPGAAALHRVGPRLGLLNVRDLLFHLPRGYADLRTLDTARTLRDRAEGTPATARLQLISMHVERGRDRRVPRTIAGLRDDSGEVEATWFGRRYLEKRLAEGAWYVFSGKVHHRGFHLSLDNPEFEPADAELTHVGRIVPVYRLTEGLSARVLRGAERAALDSYGPYPEYLEHEVRGPLPGIGEAVAAAHFPDDEQQRDAALRRLAFDELLALQLGMVSRRRARGRAAASVVAVDGARHAAAIASVEASIGDSVRQRSGTAADPDAAPIRLTLDQADAVEAIRADLARSHPMLRLLQGDVGSGKTAVAALAMAFVADSGGQAALLAPTDLLARQHLATLSNLLEPLGHEVVALTGSLSAAERRAALELARAPMPTTIDGRSRGLVFVGTHALVQEGVAFADLQLAVVDEQHRFGVAQREALTAKGGAPHVLLMTATPIPQMLAQVVYADLDVSDLRAAPSGRLPITTLIRHPNKLDRAWELVRKEAALGHRTFVVVPLIEEEAGAEVKAAEAEAIELAKLLEPLRVGMVHGRLKPAARDSVMSQFRDGALDVLVGTTVIEVGVDVPEATMMIIEGADRFGLAQLHQMRGRVGRGTAQSYCALVSEAEEGTIAWQRLEAVQATSDGFKLAETDFKLRREGELLGLRQSGLPPLRVADLQREDHQALAKDARVHAEAMVDTQGRLRPGNEDLEAELDRGWLRRVGAGDVLLPDELDA